MKRTLFTTMLTFGGLCQPAAAAGEDPRWWVAPGETDPIAFTGLIVFFGILFAIVHLYARFDRHTEHRASTTPLRTTIPTMLTVALAYEMMPALSHFSVLLPTALLLTAVARDFMLWWTPSQTTETSEKETDQ